MKPVFVHLCAIWHNQFIFLFDKMYYFDTKNIYIITVHLLALLCVIVKYEFLSCGKTRKTFCGYISFFSEYLVNCTNLDDYFDHSFILHASFILPWVVHTFELHRMDSCWREMASKRSFLQNIKLEKTFYTMLHLTIWIIVLDVIM